MKDLSKLSVIELIALREQVTLKVYRVESSKSKLAARMKHDNDIDNNKFRELMDKGTEWCGKRTEINKEIESRDIEW